MPDAPFQECEFLKSCSNIGKEIQVLNRDIHAHKKIALGRGRYPCL